MYPKKPLVNHREYIFIGYASIHLPTLSNFILFLLKDSFRRTAQKNFMKESIRELNLSKEFSSPQAYEKAKLTSSLNLV